VGSKGEPKLVDKLFRKGRKDKRKDRGGFGIKKRAGKEVQVHSITFLWKKGTGQRGPLTKDKIDWEKNFKR